MITIGIKVPREYKIKLYVKRKWWGIEVRAGKHLVATASHRTMLLNGPLHFFGWLWHYFRNDWWDTIKYNS